MSSMLCEGLQSFFEPRFVEPQIKTAPLSKPFFFELATAAAAAAPATTTSIKTVTTQELRNKNNEDVECNTKKTKCGWSLIESLTDSSSQTLKNDVKEKDQTPYVHPLVKRYSSRLSDKSLELCTESLGSESGSDIGEDTDFYYSSSSDSESEKSVTQKVRHSWATVSSNKRVNNSGSFPPPLTSISGSNSVQVRTHRENGRLVIKTVAAPRPQTYFQAERRDGRLTLRFTKEIMSTIEEPELEEVVEEEIYEQEIEKEVEEEEVVEERKEEVEIENDFDFDFDFEEEMDGNRYNIGGEMGTEKFHHRPRSCKECRQGKNGLLTWEPFWVAT
ncbi:protein FANTASTIC FOUR 1-like [Papaver somniferum]|nr:protein FANTASTIC FOUR 1-like [Papaver somniferum]